MTSRPSPRYSILTVGTFLIMSATISAQTKVDKDFVQEQRNLHEKLDCIIYDKVIEFQFSYNESTKLVEVVEKGTVKFLNLNAVTKNLPHYFWGDDITKLVWAKLRGGRAYYSSEAYNEDGIFHSNARVSEVRIPLSTNLTTDDLTYERVITDSKYLTKVYFSEVHPILHGTVSFTFPKDMVIETLDFNLGTLGISKVEEIDTKRKRITYTVENLPAFKREAQSSGAAFYMPHAIVTTKGAMAKGGEVRLMSDASDLYSWYNSLVKEMGNDRADFESLTTSLVEGCEDKTCEMQRLFYWVQDNIRYIAFEDGIAGFKPASCQDVFNKKYGDCKGMANLLTEMLKSQGIDARLAWIGTSSIPYDYSIPSLAVDNHMICAVLVDEEYIFLDATEKYIAFGDVAERIQGRQAMIQDGDLFRLVRVPVFDHNRNTEITQVDYSINAGQLQGKISYQVKGEGKVRMMRRYQAFKKKDQQNAKSVFFSKGDNNLSIELERTSELENRTSEVDWEANFTAKNRLNSFGDELYLDWDLYRSYSNSRFEEEDLLKLKGDFDFGAKIHDVEDYKIRTEKGYVVKSYPADFLKTDEHFTIKVAFTQEADGTIHVHKEFLIPHARIPNSELTSWNEAINQLNDDVYQIPIVYQRK